MLVYESLTAGQAEKAAVQRGPLCGIFTGSWGHLQWTTGSPACSAHPSGIRSKTSYQQNSFLLQSPEFTLTKQNKHLSPPQQPAEWPRALNLTESFSLTTSRQPFLSIHRHSSGFNPPSRCFMTQSLPSFGIWPDRFRLKLNPSFCWPSLWLCCSLLSSAFSQV